jgi:hypothetical protein
MKKLTLAALTILTLILTACGASSNTPQADPAAQDRTLPLATQLIIGTFKLDDTQQAVTAEQAKELLPLWQVYQDISSSDTAAQEEIDALIEQVQETMTAEQMQAITDMNLTQQDVMSVMQEQGMNISQRSNMGNGDATTTNSGGGFGPPDGSMPMGAPPDEGGFQSGQNLNPEQIATAQAARQQAGGGGGAFTPTALLDSLIKLLQEKAGS